MSADMPSATPPVRPPAGQEVVAGIDAGGSHTTVVLADSSLTVRARATGPASAVSADTVHRSAGAIRATLARALRDAAVSVRPAALVAGVAGAGRAPERSALAAALQESADIVEVTTDGAIALESAFGTGPGIVVIAGTGSIAYARNTAGSVWRVGGLGWQLGDEGSGYAVGRAALSAVGKALDGRGRSTALTEPVLAAAGCGSADELLRWAAAASPAQVAVLATAVCETAAGGDAVARKIVGEAASELAGHVRSLRARFSATAGVPVAVAGGLLQGSPLIREAFAGKLRALGGVTLVDVEVDPAVGAVRVAARLLGG